MMTQVNVLLFQLTEKTAMSLPTEAWEKIEKMIASGNDAETIALTIAEEYPR